MRNVDLNLFAVFDALERERSVTRAADALGLSQPAVSHALGRLRDLFKGPLFVRASTGMEPTPRARELAAPIREAVGQLRSTLAPDTFDPSTSRERFAIAMDNHATIVLAAPFAAEVARLAPDVGLSIKPSGTLDLDLLLKRGAIDLAVGDIARIGAYERELLLGDRYVAVMDRGHCGAEGALDLEVFAGSGHLRVSSIGEDAGFVDRELRRLGKGRTVRLEAPYIATGAALSGSDMIGVVAHGIALELCRNGRLVWRELPIGAPPVSLGMTWPPIFATRPSHRWLRTILRACAHDRSVGNDAPA